eukprot:11220614-Lingulodinium_polyedra.AAC.1
MGAQATVQGRRCVFGLGPGAASCVAAGFRWVFIVGPRGESDARACRGKAALVSFCRAQRGV